MRILLAGATGVIGRLATADLVARGHDVVAVSRGPDRDQRLRDAGATPVRLDVFDPPAVRRAADGTDVVVNLATSIPSGGAMFRRSAWSANDRLRTEASRNLAQAAVATGARFVQESFAPAYADNGAEWIDEDHPLAPVFQTTSVVHAEAAADVVRDAGLPAVTLRFGLFYGPGSPDSLAMLRAAARGRLPLPGPGDRFTSMVLVEDAASAVTAALDLPSGVYNVTEDQPMRIRDHAAVLAELLHVDRVRPAPAAARHVAALRAVGRSHRISNGRLRAASDWRPVAPTVREGWARVLGAVDVRP